MSSQVMHLGDDLPGFGKAINSARQNQTRLASFDCMVVISTVASIFRINENVIIRHAPVVSD